jgi:two-component system chemotaxis sensor kinase CheA
MDISKYKTLYLQEAREHLAGIEQSLMALEKEPEGEGAKPTIDNLFRHYHTLKGMSASMGYEPIQKFSHAQESLLSRLRSDELKLSVEITTALFACLDSLKDLVDRVEGDAPLDIPIAPFMEMIKKAEEGGSAEEGVEPRLAGPGETPPSVTAPTPTPGPPGLPGPPGPPVRSTTAAPAQPVLRISNVMKVESTVFDNLLAGVGDLFMALSTIKTISPEDTIAHKDSLYVLGKSINRLHNNILTARMLPIVDLTAGLPRVIRDISKKNGKDVDLVTEGVELSLDRAILENLGAPLVHIIRNAVDHGIEFPEERIRSGKPAGGRISIKAVNQKDHVILRISDDGRGVDVSKVRRKAVEMGMPEDHVAAMTDTEALMLICKPGLTSTDRVTDTSGRGVGMDVVKETIEGLGGTLVIKSTPGRGTDITLELPRTTSIIRSLSVTVSNEIFLIPISHIEKVVETGAYSEPAPSITYNDAEVPVIPLSRMLGLPSETCQNGPVTIILVADPEVDAEGRPLKDRAPREGQRLIGLLADTFGEELEAYVKPLTSPMSKLWGVSGITITGDGRPVFMLDIPQIVSKAHVS